MRYTVVLLLLFNYARGYGQDSLRMRWGLTGGLSINMHSAEFSKLPGYPNCCPEFENGLGIGPTFGLLASIPLTDEILGGIRLAYTSHSALLRKEQPTTVIVAGTSQQGAFEHTIDADIVALGLQPFIGYHIGGGLFANIGLNAGYVLRSIFSQKETITKPEGVGTFLDSLGNDTKSRIRNEYSGDIPDASAIILQIAAGVSFELPLNSSKTLLLAPELSYGFALSNIVSGVDWKAHNLRTMISLIYQPIPELPKPIQYDTVYLRDTSVRYIAGLIKPDLKLLTRTFSHNEIGGSITLLRTTVTESYEKLLPDDRLQTSLNVVGVNDNNVESSIARLEIEEFLSTNVQPLLHYVFFDEGSPELPSRMKQLSAADAAVFKPESLFGEQTLNIYYNLLNIIGYRLRQYPAARLTLVGCNSNEGIERDNIQLSTLRAGSIKKYLQDVWNIAPNRLTVTARNLPEKPSNPSTPDGMVENRRVEIISTISEVTDVFIANDTVRRSNPPVIRFRPSVSSVTPISSWRLTVMQEKNVLKTYSDTGTPPAMINWHLQHDPQSIPGFDKPLNIIFEVSTLNGLTSSTSFSLPTEIITIRDKQARQKGDHRIDKFNLILFEFNRSDITQTNKRIIDMVRAKITSQSELLIEGFTDRTGDASSNERLAMARAVSTREALGRSDAAVKALGENILLYNNDLPEGRFYCRTVQITAKTPY